STILNNLTDNQYSLGLRKYVAPNGEAGVANVTFISVNYNRAQPASLDHIQHADSYSKTLEPPMNSSGTKTTRLLRPPKDSRKDKTATLGSNWSDFTVSSDPNAPPNGFLFNIAQTGSDASAVIYINGIAGESTQSPAFISPLPYVNGSSSSLIPVEKVLVFFQQGIQTGTMTTYSTTDSVVIDLTENKTQTWELTNSGQWNQIQ
ncbi:hypothetical protein H0H93_008292, partial [Arthromyces matolae]